MPKGFRSAPYLYRRGQVWYFRWTYPQSICNYLGKRELRLALKTGYKAEASRRAIALAARMQLFHAQMEQETAMHAFTPAEAQALLDRYLAEALAECEAWRCRSGPLTPTDVDAELLALRYIQKDTTEQLMYHDHQRIQSSVDVLLSDAGITLPPDSPLRQQLARGLLRTSAQIAHIEIQRTLGDYTTQVQPAAIGTELPVLIPQPKLSEIVPQYVAEKLQTRCWTERTAEEAAARFRDFEAILNDPPINQINKERMRQYKSVLMRLPANRHKVARYRGKSIEQILAMDDVKPLAVKTINEYLATVAGLMGWAVDHGYLTDNPARSLKLQDHRDDDEQRAAFSKEQLERIFLCDEYRSMKSGPHARQPYQYWLPLLALFTGARIEELASLNLADIVDVDGVYVIDINTHAGTKRVKTRSALRKLAIHPSLIELGLLDYVRQVQDRGCTSLFPELSHRRGNRKGVTPSRWFARFLDRRGITGKEFVFHSFRHTLIDALKQSGVPEAIAQELAGHSSGKEGKSVTFNRYGKKLQPAVQLQYLSQVGYEIDLTALKDAWRKLMPAGGRS